MRLAVVIVLTCCTLGFAHPGGLDKNGGHHDRKNGGYHYHRGGSSTDKQEPEPKPIPPPKKVNKPVRPPTPPVVPQQKELLGKVVSIVDGDTIKVLDAKEEQWTVRLQGIDAPESKQAFGTKSRQALGEKIHEKDVVVKWKSTDAYGRVLGEVFLGDRHINLEMVKGGMAWHFVIYSKSQTLADAEAEARKAEVGLWADESPKPPWEFRVTGKKSKPADANP